jgi:type IV secretory pathway TrbD component
VIGMNRLRHAYIDLAPDIEQYLVTGHHDDELGMIETYSFRRRVGVGHLLAGSPVIVGIIDAMLSGVLAATVCAVLGAAVWVQVTSGLLVGIVVGVSLILIFLQRVRRFFRNYRPRFPHPDSP